jgi:NUMOD3 motif
MYRRQQSKETRDKISESMKGPNNHFFGKHHSDLTRHTIAEKNKGRTPWNKGLKMTMEMRKKLSISHMGIYPTKETLLKRSRALTGLWRKPISELTRMKMSRSHLGKKPSEETRMKMRRCQLNERAFSGLLSPKARYWVGFLIADGNVSIKKEVPIVALHVQERDKDHIDKKFRSFIGSSHKLGCYVNKKTKRVYCSLSFSSEIMANDLVVYGVRTKKSFVAKVKRNIENDRDTWRGTIDGDGHLGIYKRRTKNGVTRLIPYISLTGSLNVCLQFKTFLEYQIGMPMPNIISSKKSYFFSVSDHRAVRAIKLLYEDCAVALDRKLEIAKKILASFLLQGNSRYLRRIPI